MKEKRSRVILVVDDEDAVRLTLRDYLKSSGYTVHVASDGVGAIKILIDYNIDVILTDYRMEIFGGDYWIKFLHKYCGDKKIIITSGFLDAEPDLNFPIVYKPFDYADIAALIES